MCVCVCVSVCVCVCVCVCVHACACGVTTGHSADFSSTLYRLPFQILMNVRQALMAAMPPPSARILQGLTNANVRQAIVDVAMGRMYVLVRICSNFLSSSNFSVHFMVTRN